MKRKIKTGVDKILSAVELAELPSREWITVDDAGNPVAPFYPGTPESSEAEKRRDKKIDAFQKKSRLQYERRQAEKLMDPESRKFFADESRPSYQFPERRLRDRRKVLP